MPTRYKRAPRIRGGKAYGTYSAGHVIYRAVQSRSIDFVTRTTKESERLDIIAGEFYDNGSLWWVISAASGIGWGLQVPPGTQLIIPTDISQISALVG
tara:strand:+ start:49 stop:342 length:294 start_codon:yes stop_codon:yes gene_type:complete